MRRTWLIRDGDLVGGADGQFVELEGLDATLSDAARELMAPVSARATVAYDHRGVALLGGAYGGFLQPLRSRPLRDIPVDVIIAGVRRVLSKYPELTLDDLTLDPSTLPEGKLRIVAPAGVGNSKRQFYIDIDGTMLTFTD